MIGRYLEVWFGAKDEQNLTSVLLGVVVPKWATAEKIPKCGMGRYLMSDRVTIIKIEVIPIARPHIPIPYMER